MFGRGVVLAAVVVALDQLGKWVILSSGLRVNQVVRVTPFLDLVLNWNPGISFGLFRGGAEFNRWMFIAVALLVSLALLSWLRHVERPILGTALALVIGGALGNVIDRMRFGAVVDFLYFHWHDYGFPAFNLADSAITIGVGLILIDSLLTNGRSRK